MAITEESRHKLYQRLEEVLGSEQAAILMEHLPPVGWADIATKRDLDQLEAAMTRDFARIDLDLGRLKSSVEKDIENSANVLRVEFRRDLLTQTFALIAANTTMLGFAFAVAKLV